MPNGLDHVVHAVHDLDAAGAFYERAGFIVGARNRHPFGTHNRIVQFDGVYIELIEVAEPDKIHPARDGSVSFGAFHRDFLAQREGLSMLLAKSDNAAADARAYAKAGIGSDKTFEFAREGKSADGAVVKLAFSLAFARDPLSAGAAFAACQHHYPENFWNKALQAHANGVRRVRSVWLVAERPASHADFLRTWTGRHAGEGDDIRIAMGNCDLALVTPEALRGDVESDVPPGPGLSICAMRFDTDDLAETGSILAKAGIAARPNGETLIVPPQAAFGATLIFAGTAKG